MASVMRATVLSMALAMLGACGGGGGGGGGVVAPTEVPFTSFGAIAANQTVVMDGTAVTASGTQTIANDDATITSASFNPVGGATVRLGYDGSRTLRAISINTPQSSVSFDRDAQGHRLSCSGTLCLASNGTAEVIAADPFAPSLNWNYQSFGIWSNDLSATSWVAGAVSAGSPTSGSSLPTTGTARFTGLAGGFFFDSVGTPFATFASMSADVNFGSQNIVFSTANTTALNANTGSERPGSADLNLRGVLSYAQGVNAFSGTVTTAPSAGLSGQASGRFYGPAAEEIGGVYSLSGAGLSRMAGGFGGKRSP
jgi:hypothetical protein